MDFRRGQTFIDLSGEWSFAFGDRTATGFKSGREIADAGLGVYSCSVPGNFELDLEANGMIDDPFFGTNILGLRKFERSNIWYFREFEVHEQPPGFAAQLVFEGLDCIADIYLNGSCIGSVDNMLIEHVLDVDGLLRESNELLVHIKPAVKEARKHEYPVGLNAGPYNYESLYIRKAPHMYGWDIMPRSLSGGMWRPVKLRFRPNERLDEVFLQTMAISPDHNTATLCLHYRGITSEDGECEIRIHGTCQGSEFHRAERVIFDNGSFLLEVTNPMLWWPKTRGPRNLYDVTVSLMRANEEIDRLTFRHGIRTVDLVRTAVTDRDGDGEFCFKVNGEKIFVLGTNWVPLDAFHSRDAAKIPETIALVDDIGCNMIRCWGGNVYENDLFYELCDEKGILVWQDFAMACAIYPNNREFCSLIEVEARSVVKRLRQHACLVLWCGDNECDWAHVWDGHNRNPNENRITREVLPEVLRDEDPSRPYLPSSPCLGPEAFTAGEDYVPEAHLWGPRDYYKSDYYRTSLCHFVSEIGFYSCPSIDSMRKFISPANIRLPDSYSEEWILHSTSPLPGVGRLDDRVKQLVQHIHELFGLVPDNMEDFVFASQAFQAEAMKFSIESFRSAKWRRTGIIWWNIKDGWPQFSDAVVDYYFNKKMAYDFIKRSQSPLCLVLREPIDGRHELVACNDTREDLQVEYTVEDADCGEVLCRGIGVASSDSVSLLDSLGQVAAGKRFYIIKWSTILGEGVSHYLAGDPPFDLGTFKRWLEVLHSSVEQTHHHSDSREDVNICLPHRTADTGIPLGAIKG